MFDYLVVGCGFSGATFAERIARVLAKKVLIVDKRDHFGGTSSKAGSPKHVSRSIIW